MHDFSREAQNAAAFAQAQWGPTGFLCPHCHHDQASCIRTRPRVRQCRRCHRQTSVTSGTLLHGSRLPIQVWIEAFDRFGPHIDTAREAAERWGIALSTAWLLTQKLLLHAVRSAPAGPWPEAPVLRLAFPVLRPKGPKPLGPAAPAWVRELHEAHRRLASRLVDVAFECRDSQVAVARIPVSEREWMAMVMERKAGLPGHAVYGFAMWIGAWRVDRPYRRRRFSLRWLPRWLGGMGVIWNRLGPPDRPWEPTAISLGRQPLRTLDPWTAG